ncbi:MAG: hypothetical protein EXR71_04260 [Myxococcales bacterium]|nr:hypothetical protein [Myxococcales bacterium]
MGGFAGLLGARSASTLVRMARVLDARGPAARWEGAEGGAAFVVAASGVPGSGSPVGSAEGVLVAVDGPVSGLKALAAEMELEADAEVGMVLARLVARTGFSRAFARLPGDVSLAAWDVAAARGWLARDRAGARGLRWARVEGGIAFCTDPRGLLVAGLIEPGREAGGLAAGQVMEVCGDVVSPGAVPLAPVHPRGSAGNLDRWTRSLRFGLDLAYATRVRSCQPHAIALSGGAASAALVAVRPREAGPTVALTLRGPRGIEPGVHALAAAAGLRLVDVTWDADVLASLMEEVAPAAAWARPEAWAWAALARAAWREGALGMVAGVGAGHGFDPPVVGRLSGFVGRRARELTPEEERARTARGLLLPEVELADLDAGCASFGLDAIAPFADPAVLGVACAVPAGAHHAGGRRALLVAVARAGGVDRASRAPEPWQVLSRGLLPGLPDEPVAMRRSFAEHIGARGLLGPTG